MEKKISKELLKKLLAMAHLSASQEDLEVIAPQLAKVLDYFSDLEQLNVDLPGTSQTTGLQNVFREDKIESSMATEDVLYNSKSTLNGFVKTDIVLQKK